jgi:hypothetical protein
LKSQNYVPRETFDQAKEQFIASARRQNIRRLPTFQAFFQAWIDHSLKQDVLGL